MSINNSIPLFLAKMVKIPNRISHSHQSKKIKNILKIVYEKINKFIIKRCANQYVACGEEAARYLYSNKLCNDKKVIILKNAIDLEKYKFNADSRAKIRRQYGIKNDDILLGHVGRFTYQKNQIGEQGRSCHRRSLGRRLQIRCTSGCPLTGRSTNGI